MSTPNQMFSHALNGIKGFYPGQPWIVDKAADVASSELSGSTYPNIIAGRVATLTGSGVWQAGTTAITSSSTAVPIPHFLFQSASDFDVVGDDGNFVGAPVSGTSATPRVMGVACTQAAELETTEYISGTYTPGTLLVSENANAGVIGKLKPYTASTAAVIVGVVTGSGTSGLVTSPHSASLNVLRFQTCFVPKFA